LVAIRVLGSLGDDLAPLVDALCARYAAGSGAVARFAVRVALPAPTTPVPPPAAPSPSLAAAAAARAIAALAGFDAWPEVVHPIPLFGDLDAAAFRRVLPSLVVRRLPAGAVVVRQGEPGTSFYMVATGEVVVRRAPPAGPP